MSRLSPPARVDERIDYKLQNIWTLVPAIIVGVDSVNMTCNVKIKARIEETDFPILRDIPIVWPKGKNSLLKTPIAKGDVVLCGFSKFALHELLIDGNVVEVDKPRLGIEDAFILGGFVLSPKTGTVIYGTETYDVPTSGAQLISDESVVVTAPTVRMVDADGKGFEVDETGDPGIDFITQGPINFRASMIDFITSPIKDIKHRISDPAVGDLEEGEINTGLVGGTGKIYLKKNGTIYVFNHDATIT